MGILLFQLCMRSWSNGEEACYIDGVAYLEEGFRGGTLRPPSFAWRWPQGKIIHRPVGKAVGNLLGCLYVGCVGCGAARSVLLFGYVLVLCSEPLDLHLFPSFAFASWVLQAVE